MQGDIASAINEMVKKLQVDTAASSNSEYLIERYVQDVIDTYGDAIEQKKEMYRWDSKSENLFEYFGKLQKNSQKLFEEREKRRERIKFLGDQINLYKKQENEATLNNNDKLSDAIFKKRVQLEIEKDVKEAMDDVANTVESGAKSGNPYLAAVIIGVGAIIDIGKMLFNVAKSILTVGFSFLKKMLGTDLGVGAVFEKFLEMQKLVGRLSADSGLLANEAMNFLGQMPTIMNEVLDVGGSIEQVGEAYEGYNKLTNRNRVFSGKEFKSIIELGLGTGLGVSAAGELVGNFENLGYSLDKTLKFTDFVRKKSMGVSQNQTSVLIKANELITELSGFGIEKGLEGMAKLVIQTQKARVDVKKSVASFKDAFTDPETAVDVAATAQLLGGKFAFYFGDPFILMGKSMEDPLQLTADLMKVVKDKAFKGKNGFEISPANRELIREFAKSIGQDSDELFNAAIEDAKYTDKIEALRKRGVKTFGLSDEQNELLTNLMTMNKDGSYSLRLSNGAIKRLEEIPSNELIYKTIQQDRKNEESALLRKTLAERIGIAIDRFNIGFSQVFVVLDRYFTNSNVVNNLDQTVANVSTNLINWLNTQLSGSGEWGIFIKKGLKAANEFIDKILGIWMNPDTVFTEKFGETLRFIFKSIKDIMMPYIEYYSGRLIELLGKVLPAYGSKFEKAGLELQKKGMKRAGKNSMLANNNEDLTRRINEWNANNGGVDITGTGIKVGAGLTSIGIKKISEKLITKGGVKALAGVIGKNIAKKLPGISLAIGIFDAIGQAMEGDWDQAAISMASGVLATALPGIGTAVSIGLDVSNMYIDAKRGDNHIDVNDAMIKSDGTYKSGAKGSAIDYLTSVGGNYEKSPNKVDLVLTGRIKHSKKNNNINFNKKSMDKTVVATNKLILEQLILNLKSNK
jgi:hypothetical protein